MIATPPIPSTLLRKSLRLILSPDTKQPPPYQRPKDLPSRSVIVTIVAASVIVASVIVALVVIPSIIVPGIVSIITPVVLTIIVPTVVAAGSLLSVVLRLPLVVPFIVPSIHLLLLSLPTALRASVPTRGRCPAAGRNTQQCHQRDHHDRL